MITIIKDVGAEVRTKISELEMCLIDNLDIDNSESIMLEMAMKKQEIIADISNSDYTNVNNIEFYRHYKNWLVGKIKEFELDCYNQ